MYYVYMLIDPRNDQPFYVGKGTGNRAVTHLFRKKKRVENQYKEDKIKAIRAAGLEPCVVYVAENILDEELAHTIETELIMRYGRKGYEPTGILTNKLLDGRPPNHRGKTYEEIYGSPERAQEQREKRARLQKERGGYGPKKHSEETKRQYSITRTGKKYGPCSEGRKQKIGEANRKYAGETNKKSFEWKCISPMGEIHTTIGNIDKLCKTLGLPVGTIRKMLYGNGYQPKSGPAVGWKIESLPRTDTTQPHPPLD
ncbi:GIY-YIG_COG3680 domain containing protein [uncultured Caudovirales phage]|uniref:GIY-YIG_COG3680 domain containing protein n=1 Tax=uncultured Caudovirales phage TaxID=2100421 RepID=A0A6J5KP56_9CAUD|nr:GIY-YIG_COG3680 domain containing protein [uncultured Caudovirales phage]